MIGAAAAATSASRRRRVAQYARERQALQDELARQRRARKERANKAFEDMVQPPQTLLYESQISAFLNRVLQIPTLHPDAVQLVLDTARRRTAQESARHDDDKTPQNPSPSQGLDKEALINSVEKYGEYIQKAKTVDKAFRKYDREKDGSLSRNELHRLLRDYELKAGRTLRGMVIRLVPTDEDVDWVIAQCDVEGDGTICQAEYLPAIAAWEELAQLKMLQQSQACCVIL